MLLALLAAAYSFHIQVTDARTALLANPHFDELKLTPAQLERAAHDRVMMLDHTTGTHWIWLMMSWPADQTHSIRFVQEQCRIGTVMVKKVESTDVPFDSDVTVETTVKRH